jgi:hypothetical protein
VTEGGGRVLALAFDGGFPVGLRQSTSGYADGSVSNGEVEVPKVRSTGAESKSGGIGAKFLDWASSLINTGGAAMAVRFETVAESRTTRDLESGSPVRQVSGWIGAGLVVLAAGLAVGTYLMISVVANVPGTLHGQWECRALEQNTAVWTDCLFRFDPRMRVDAIAGSDGLIRE